MSTYTKHVTQISLDNDWQLDFDVEVTTPEKINSLSENKSIINGFSNPVITFLNNSKIGTAKLRGSCFNTIWINGIFQIKLRATGEIPSGTTGNMAEGETTLDKTYIASHLPLGFSELGDIVINHNQDGSGGFQFQYNGRLTGDSSTHNSIDFSVYVELNTINVQNIPFTEMSSNIKEALVNGNVAIKTKIIVNDPDVNTGISPLNDNETTENEVVSQLVLTQDDAIKTWELNDERYVPDNGFIGQFVARTLNGELHNISDDFNIENKDIELQMGVVQLGTQYQWLTTEDGEIIIDENGNRVYAKDLGDDITTWYSLGNFLVTKPEDDEVADNTKFEAFDYATKFNADFNASYVDSNYVSSFNNELKINGDVTAGWLAAYTCAQVGIELATPTFTNSDFKISSNQFTQGESCRDVMKAISQLAFGWCRIGWDNKCYIDEPTTVALTSGDTNILTNDNYYSLRTQKRVYGPINRVVIGMSAVKGEEAVEEDIDSIAANGVTELQIMDNPILYTKDLRSSIIESSKKLFGLYYTPLEMETPGHPWLVGNELIDVQDMEGNDRYTYPFNRTISYTGHIKTKLITPAPTKQANSTAYSKTLYKTVRKIGITVDAQEGTITAINSRLKAAEDGLSSVESKVETEMTDTYTRTQIQEIINGTAEDGTVVSSVKTTSGTFDKNGLTIEQTDKPNTKTNLNADGMIIYDKTGGGLDPLLTVNSDGVIAKNIKVSTYLNIGSHSRIEDYVHTDYTEGTGVFWIGGGF